MVGKILIVDDQIGIRELLKLVLKEYQLQLANNGLDALKIAEEWEPDLIIIDWKMPIMSGEEALLRIKELNIGTRPRIILMTADEDFSENNVQNLQIDTIVYKPFDLFDFLQKVNILLEKDGH